MKKFIFVKGNITYWNSVTYTHLYYLNHLHSFINVGKYFHVNILIHIHFLFFNSQFFYSQFKTRFLHLILFYSLIFYIKKRSNSLFCYKHLIISQPRTFIFALPLLRLLLIIIIKVCWAKNTKKIKNIFLRISILLKYLIF